MVTEKAHSVVKETRLAYVPLKSATKLATGGWKGEETNVNRISAVRVSGGGVCSRGLRPGRRHQHRVKCSMSNPATGGSRRVRQEWDENPGNVGWK